MLNSTALLWLALGIAMFALGASAWLATHGKIGEAALMAGFVVTAVAFGSSRPRLPPIFTLLFALAAGINALGYVLELWHNPVWFDEVVHVLTPFTIVAAIGWLSIKRTGKPSHYLAKMVLVGIALGLAWEAFEWMIGIIGTFQDTLLDLLMDTIGATLASWFSLSVYPSEPSFHQK
jgi:hypothetical protein